MYMYISQRIAINIDTCMYLTCIKRSFYSWVGVTHNLEPGMKHIYDGYINACDDREFHHILK